MDGNMINNMQRPRGRRMTWVFVVIVLALLGLAVKYFFGDQLRTMSLGATSEYQSVFLTNGQVYFGKLGYEGHWLALSDVYYLQVSEDLQSASSGNQNTPSTPATNNDNQKIQLVKLGSELHGPTDKMYIAKDKILFWENMKDDSKVLQSIKQYKGQ